MTKASLMISTPQRLFISVLVNRDCPTAFMIKIRKSVQNIIRHLMKSAVGNGQKCNCVMIRLMRMTFKDRPLELGELVFGLLANNHALSCQTEMKVIRADGKRVGFGNAFLGTMEVLETASTQNYIIP